jgi:sensor c-di-GMP phosphodiesterase-like protein
MGLIARAWTRKNLIAIIAGVVLAGAPMLAFNFWIGGLIDRQGQDDVGTSAQRAIALAESRVSQVIEALDGLAARGVDGCEPADIAAMRQASFDTAPIKEIGIIGANERTLCTDLGLPLGRRTTVASEPLSGANWYTLDIVQLESGQPMVQLRRAVGGGPTEIAALVPAFLFLPQVSTHGNPFSAYAHITTASGTSIGTSGVRPNQSEASFVAKSKSEKFGFNAEVAMPRSNVIAGRAELQWLGLSATGAAVIIIGVFIFVMTRRTPANPVAEIENALRAGEFVPYYQPIVDIRSGQLRGAEVLVRWRKPDGSLVLPGSFIPLTESSGLIRDMTRDLMRRVCIEAGEALGRRPGMKISFNLAGQLFSDESIVDDIRKIFAGTPIKFSQVVLEVTERDPIENFTATRQTIAAFQGLGMRIAIDDVGTGHSGLSYMLKLGVDIIKIDKMFVDAIGTDRNSTTIVETLVDLASNMRMDVVAEGVENFEQVVYLRELGVRLAQGYVFAPPLPGKAFLQLVEAIDPLPAAADRQAERHVHAA